MKDIRKKLVAVASTYCVTATVLFSIWLCVSLPRIWHFTASYISNLFSLIP